MIHVLDVWSIMAGCTVIHVLDAWSVMAGCTVIHCKIYIGSCRDVLHINFSDGASN